MDVDEEKVERRVRRELVPVAFDQADVRERRELLARDLGARPIELDRDEGPARRQAFGDRCPALPESRSDLTGSPMSGGEHAQ